MKSISVNTDTQPLTRTVFLVLLPLFVTGICALPSGEKDVTPPDDLGKVGKFKGEQPNDTFYRRLLEFLDTKEETIGEDWDGRWFPKNPTPSRQGKNGPGKDEHGRVLMGVPSEHCDDGKTNLTMDWNGSVVNYTCFHPETRYPQEEFYEPVQHCVDLPSKYRPDHFCMDKPIPYKDGIPTHGPHRPLWPKFGEYTFVPRERWLHNIEHGAVVMLYHPCAYAAEVDRLRKIVTGCVGKYVITPSTFVTPTRPLALVAWGCRLEMSLVNDDTAINFIREKALHGPEGNYTKEGQFDKGLIKFSNQSGNAVYDRVLC